MASWLNEFLMCWRLHVTHKCTGPLEVFSNSQVSTFCLLHPKHAWIAGDFVADLVFRIRATPTLWAVRLCFTRSFRLSSSLHILQETSSLRNFGFPCISGFKIAPLSNLCSARSRCKWLQN
jgi:hypothetical protein